MKPANILLVSRKWPRRGQYTSVEHFLDYFEGYPKLLVSAGEVKFYRLFKWLANFVRQSNYSSFSAYIEFRTIWKSLFSPIKHVHFFYGDHDYHVCGYVLPKFKITISATFYFSPEELKTKFGTYQHLKHLKTLFSTGPDQFKYLQIQSPKSHINLLPLGIDTIFFKPDLASKKDEPFHILQSGLNRRDFKLLKQVLREFSNKYPDICVSMIGCNTQADHFSELAFCHFYNQLSDEEFRAFYQKAHVMLLPLEDGATSNSLVEALACGLPVIATDIPNFSYFCKEGVYLCKPPYVETMLNQLEYCYTHSKELVQKGLDAREYALQFDWANIKSQMTCVWSIDE